MTVATQIILENHRTMWDKSPGCLKFGTPSMRKIPKIFLSCRNRRYEKFTWLLHANVSLVILTIWFSYKIEVNVCIFIILIQSFIIPITWFFVPTWTAWGASITRSCIRDMRGFHHSRRSAECLLSRVGAMGMKLSANETYAGREWTRQRDINTEGTHIVNFAAFLHAEDQEFFNKNSRDSKLYIVWLRYFLHTHILTHFTLCTWSVQKVSRILNFRGLRIFDFRFFSGVMLVLMSLTYADKLSHFECSVNFWQLFCLDVFWLVFDFCLFQKMDQRIAIQFCVKNKIKCVNAFRMLTVAYGEATLDCLARHSGSPRPKKARQVP